MLLNKKIVDEYVELRKMNPQDKMKLVKSQDEFYEMRFDDIIELAKELSVDVSLLFTGISQSDVNDGVRVAKKNEVYARKYTKDGKEVYTYNHLVTTKDHPSMMPLRVEVHLKQDDNIIINGGHGSAEIVYITKGDIIMVRQFEGKKHTNTLCEGDSVYITPKTPHGFKSNSSQDAELIAINW